MGGGGGERGNDEGETGREQWRGGGGKRGGGDGEGGNREGGDRERETGSGRPGGG